MGFLIRDYPIRTGILTVLCILSYLLPLTIIENAVDPIKPRTDAPAAEAAIPTVDPSTAAANHVRALAQGNPATMGQNVIGLWQSVLSGLSSIISSSGGSAEAPDLQKKVDDRLAMGGSTNNISNANPIEKKFFSQRLGRHLRQNEVLLVEQFWFFARCCLLAGAGYSIWCFVFSWE